MSITRENGGAPFLRYVTPTLRVVCQSGLVVIKEGKEWIGDTCRPYLVGSLFLEQSASRKHLTVHTTCPRDQFLLSSCIYTKKLYWFNISFSKHRTLLYQATENKREVYSPLSEKLFLLESITIATDLPFHPGERDRPRNTTTDESLRHKRSGFRVENPKKRPWWKLPLLNTERKIRKSQRLAGIHSRKKETPSCFYATATSRRMSTARND